MRKSQSPIETSFGDTLLKHLSDEYWIEPQQKIETSCGIFAVDFFVKPRGGKERGIIFECDGKDYHVYLRDAARDSLLLNTSVVSAIWRVKGGDIYHALNDCLYLVSQFHRRLFSDRSLANLDTLTLPLSQRGFSTKKTQSGMCVWPNWSGQRQTIASRSSLSVGRWSIRR